MKAPRSQFFSRVQYPPLVKPRSAVSILLPTNAKEVEEDDASVLVGKPRSKVSNRTVGSRNGNAMVAAQ